MDPAFLAQYSGEPFVSPDASYYEEDALRQIHSMSSSNLNRLAGPPIAQVRPQSVPPPTSSRDKGNSRPAEGDSSAYFFLHFHQVLWVRISLSITFLVI